MLEPVFNDLCLQLARLRTALRAVQVSVAGDTEAAGETRTLALLLGEVMERAERARKASRLPVDIDGVRRALPRCQRQFGEWKDLFYAGPGSPAREERLAEAECHEALYYTRRCSEPLFAAERALSACWQKVGLYSALNPGGVVPGLPPLP